MIVKTPARKRAGVCFEPHNAPSDDALASPRRNEFETTPAMSSASQTHASSSSMSPLAATEGFESVTPLGRHRLFRHPRIRAGAVVKSLLTTVCGAAMLMTAAAVLDPATLEAGSIPQARPVAARDARNELMRSISSLVGQCREVLAINHRIEDRGAEIILWFEDTHDLGRINADELALLRHSPLFQTITVYTASKAVTGRRSNVAPQSDADNPTSTDIAAPGFIDRWRAMSAVQARVVATGISDLKVEAVEGRGQSRLSNLRLHLQWTGDSVDGSDEASALVAAGRTSANTAAQQKQQEYTP